MSGQRGLGTNFAAASRTLTMRMRVDWPEGEMPSLATLRATRAVRVGSTTYPTFWRSRGAPHRDGSLRLTWAEWHMTIDAGVAGTPTAEAVVVIADNSGIGDPSFPAWFNNVGLTVAYTANEPTGTSSVSVDVLALARAETNGNGFISRTEGGTRFVTFSAWTGPGRRHEPRRSGAAGNNGGGAPVLRNGLLRWLVNLEIRDQDQWCKATVRPINGAACAYPAAPHDGGTRVAGSPGRPTFLDPAVTNPITDQTEQRESSAIRYLQSLTLTWTCSSATIWARPWYVRDHATGAGPYGTLPTSGNTTSVPLTHLGFPQGQGLRFAISAVSEADAVEKAAREWGYFLPTKATWDGYAVRSRTLVGGEVDGDEFEVRGWETMLPEDVPTSTIDRWYDEGPAFQTNFMAPTIASIWDRLGASRTPDGTGVHRHLGFNKEAEAALGASPWHLYVYGAQSLREYCARYAHFETEYLAELDVLSGASSGRFAYTAGFNGTNLLNPSMTGFGIMQRGGTGSPGRAHFQGAPVPLDNPQSGANLEEWNHYNHGHFGVRRLWMYASLTDDEASRQLLEHYARIALQGFHDREYHGIRSPTDFEPRSEYRVPWVIWHGYLLSDDATFRAQAKAHCVQRNANHVRSGTPGYWTGGIGRSNDTKEPDGSACGITPYTAGNLSGRQWFGWQTGQGLWHMLNWMLEADDDEDARDIALGIMYASRYLVEEISMCNPAELSAAAQRPIDSCFAGRAAQLGSPGSAGYPNEGYMIAKVRGVDTARSGGAIVQFVNVLRDVGPDNHGQAKQLSPGYWLALCFAANRARAGFEERCLFLRERVTRRFPELLNGAELSNATDLGYAVGDPRPDGATGDPVTFFTVDVRSGTIPLEVELDSAGSSIPGDEEEALYEWFDHYVDESTPVSASGVGSAYSTRSVTYNGPGLYRPALRITAESGRSHLYVDPIGIDARQAVVLAPSPSFTADELSVTAGDLVQFTYAELGGRALTYLWEYKASSEPTVWTPFSTVQNPVWEAPATAGTYDFRVTASNETAPSGVTATRSAYVTVGAVTAPPSITISASPTTGNAPLSVDVEVTVGYSGALGSLTIDGWKNSTTGTGTPDDTIVGDATVTFSFTYNTAGSFWITIKATQEDGQSTTRTLEFPILVTIVPVADPPEPDFTASPTSVAGGDEVALTYIDRGVRATSWAWDSRLNGESTWVPFSTQRSPVWIAPLVDGSYDFRVTASNEFGAGAPKVKLALVAVDAVTPPPDIEVEVDPTLGPYPLEVELDASATVLQGDSEASTWEWFAHASDAAATATFTGAIAGSVWTHEYELPGLYQPKLVVTQEDGQSSEWIFEPGILVTTDPTTDPPAGTLTTSSSTLRPGEDATITWTDAGIPATAWVFEYSPDSGSTWISFGTANPASFRAPVTAGSYEIRCRASNANGETTVELDAPIVVSSGELPDPAFTLSAYRFDGQSEGYPTPWVRVLSNDTIGAEVYHWRIEGGGWFAEWTGALPPPFQLPSIGTFTVTLTATNAFGASAAFARISVLSGGGAELRGSFSTRTPRLLGRFPGTPTPLRATWVPTLSPDPSL